MENTQTVLITGGSGLVGSRLTEMLLAEGYAVCHLGRSKGKGGIVKQYLWSPGADTIEEEAVKHADYIVHLAGAGVADKAWSVRRKKEIIDSRVKGAELLFRTLKNTPNKLKAFISSSGIGIYGNTGNTTNTEDSPCADDFLAFTCTLWEKAANAFSTMGKRTVKIRTGMVLAKEGGALPQLALPVKCYAGSPLGSGEQYVSWIHIDDLCQVYIKAIKDEQMSGAYNAVSPGPVRNKELITAIAKELKKPLFMPAVPGPVLKFILGERSAIVLDGCKASANKIIESGYSFRYPTIADALAEIYKPVN